MKKHAGCCGGQPQDQYQHQTSWKMRGNTAYEYMACTEGSWLAPIPCATSPTHARLTAHCE
jgi:hypothetical protein